MSCLVLSMNRFAKQTHAHAFTFGLCDITVCQRHLTAQCDTNGLFVFFYFFQSHDSLRTQSAVIFILLVHLFGQIWAKEWLAYSFFAESIPISNI